MKIALYYPWIYTKSGVERSIIEIIRRSKHNVTIFTNHYDPLNTYPYFRHVKIKLLNRVSVHRDLLSVAWAALVLLFQKIDLSSFDLLLVHSDGLADLVLFRNYAIPTVCFCHTPLRPTYDSYYRSHTLEKYSSYNRIFFLFASFLYKIVNIYIWRKYAYVFFNSNETKKRAASGALLNDKQGKWEVLHPGVDDYSKAKIKYEPFFLIPGRVMWTKQIELGIQSFLTFKYKYPQHTHFRLIIAGHVDKKSPPYLSSLQALSAKRKDIEFIISPSEARLHHLYAACWAVLLTSFNEDWGLTVLEGNAFKKPVIAVDRGGPRESQINNVTGFLVRSDPKNIAQKMALLADNIKLTRTMGKQAQIHVQQYGWDQFVKKIDTVLERVVLAH